MRLIEAIRAGPSQQMTHRQRRCYYAGMTGVSATKALTVRDIPTAVLDEISGRAARSGRSLQEYVRGHLVEWASRPEPDDWAAQVRARKAATGGGRLGDLALRDAELP